MSSVRIYILSSLADGGDMHGYQLRQIAEKERVEMWSDITPGGLYDATRRLAREGLIERSVPNKSVVIRNVSFGPLRSRVETRWHECDAMAHEM